VDGEFKHSSAVVHMVFGRSQNKIPYGEFVWYNGNKIPNFDQIWTRSEVYFKCQPFCL